MIRRLLSRQTLNEKLLNMVLRWSSVTHLPGVSILMAKMMTGISVLVLASTSMQVSCLQLFLVKCIIALMTAVRSSCCRQHNQSGSSIVCTTMLSKSFHRPSKACLGLMSARCADSLTNGNHMRKPYCAGPQIFQWLWPC